VLWGGRGSITEQIAELYDRRDLFTFGTATVHPVIRWPW
jgi:hypothetical protein